MNQNKKSTMKKIAYGPLYPVFSLSWTVFASVQRLLFRAKWKLKGLPMPTDDEIKLMRENVTFIFKSFERKSSAKRLYRSIQKYYPGVKVIIADDSKKPLMLKSEHVQVVHLPFNSGLSKGLNKALALVDTPFAIRMDDDQVLTPYTTFHKHLQFLRNHSELDLISVFQYTASAPLSWQSKIKPYFKETMDEAPKPLKIPHGTFLDKSYVVLGKVPNVFVARTGKFREVGYDDNIRMTDHLEFFFRAAGVLASALALDSFVLHYHNPFNKKYKKFRGDIAGDCTYIKNKHPLYFE